MCFRELNVTWNLANLNIIPKQPIASVDAHGGKGKMKVNVPKKKGPCSLSPGLGNFNLKH